jgi:tetratricopeptide (TPR) repeat protein
MTEPSFFGGQFEIERLASSGGMASVYRARDRSSGALVALKVLHAASAQFAGHFARESYVLAELDHPGIVRYVGHGAAPTGELYLAMEWLEGEDLSKRLERGPLSVAETITLGVRVAEALGAAHARGVVHRDIKPGNLFLPDNDIGRVKILDFGIARPQATRPATRTGILLGTPGYMAPEQALGARVIDPRADVFSLGTVLYECLTGQAAFEAGPLLVLLSKMLAPEPPRPADLRSDVPAALDEVVARMLAHEPAHRPENGAAVAAEIAMLDDAETAWVQGGVPMHRLGHAPLIEDPFDISTVGLPADLGRIKASTLGAAVGAAVGSAPTVPLEAYLGERAPRTEQLPESDVGADDDDAAFVPFTRLANPTPFFGRDREIDEIYCAFSTCAAASSSFAMIVTGEPGAGKSRLVAQLLHALDQRGGIVDPEGIVRPIAIFAAEADPTVSRSPFALAAELVRNAAGVRRGDPVTPRRDRLLQSLARRLGPEDATRVVGFLGELTGTPILDDTSVPLRAARQDARLMGDHIRRAFEDWLAAECEAQPVLVILEDLDHADAASIALMEGALTSLAPRPLFVLATARSASAWPGAAGRARVLALPPLSAEASAAIVRHVLGALSETSAARIVEQGGGNPLHIEMLARAAASGRSDVGAGSLEDLVRASFAELSPNARRVLGAASVFGNVFFPAALLTALGTPASGRASTVDVWGALRAAFAELAAREIILRRGKSGSPWGAEHAFRHSILRRAAYEALGEDERARLHLGAGLWLERADEADPGVIAVHFAKAGALERAVPWAALSAERAFEASDFEAVLAWVGRGLSAAGEGEVRGALRLFESQARKFRGEHRAALESGREAMRSLPHGSPLWYSAAGEVALAAGNLGDDAELIAVFDTLSALGEEGEAGGPHVIAVARVAMELAMAGHHDRAEFLFDALDALSRRVPNVDPEVWASVHRARAFRAMFAGDAGTSVREFEAAAERFEQVGDLRNACVQRVNVGSATNELGDWTRAEASLRDALAQAERMGLGALVAQAKLNLGVALMRQGALADARAVEADALRTYARQGDRRCEGGARLYLAMIHLAGSDHASAEREARAAIELLAGHPPVRAHALAVLGRIELARGCPEAALGPSGKAVALLESLGGIEEGESLVRLVHAEALSALGQPAEAREAILSAYERLSERASKIKNPMWRAWFLEAVPENARTVALARAWGAVGGPCGIQDEDTSS